MKISFSCPLTRTSGKQIFVCRLSESLIKKGVKITDKKPDINVVIVKGSKHGCKNVLRLDGIWMNSEDKDLKNKNNKIGNLIKSCDGVIYQNEFCKEASDKIVGVTNKNYDIIGNGIDPKEIIVKSTFENKKPFFLGMCKWRPHKRYKDIAEGFLASGLKKDFDLVIFGQPDKIVKDDSIKHYGDCPNHVLLGALSRCSGTAHLAYVDWCPNSVVESIMAKKPVLHTSSGGTKLIVQKDGYCIPEKEEWNFRITKLYKPPPLNIEEVGLGFKKLIEIPPIKERKDLHIDTIADQYINFFNKVLS